LSQFRKKSVKRLLREEISF